MAVEAVIGEPVSASYFPGFAGKYREILVLQGDYGRQALLFATKFNDLRLNSLRIRIGNFAGGTANGPWLSRENALTLQAGLIFG